MALPPPSKDKQTQEFGAQFAPKFDAAGLVTAVTVDADSKDVIMVAHMNEEAIQATLTTGYAHYWSRSRQSLWKKGESSGELQEVVTLHTDCDQDAIVVAVNVQGRGSACHNGFKSCFYREVRLGDGEGVLTTVSEPLVSADTLYSKE